MFPVSDDDSQRRNLPVVTYILIIINVLFFLVELSAGDQFIQKWAFIPARSARSLDRFTAFQWCGLDCSHRRNSQRWRRSLHGTHRRVFRRTDSDLPISGNAELSNKNLS
jgi:membrane associated rhomboid family serine protease